MNKILSIRNLKKNFNTIKGEIIAIGDISFDINEGDFVALVGPSGCGKSTLLSILASLEDATSGEIIYNKTNPRIGYMLQDDALLEHLTIKDNTLLGLRILGLLDNKNITYVDDLLKKYDLDKFKNKYPKELSGGMKQRVALIRTLAINPDILFLDEPFSALDYTTRLNVSNDVYSIIKKLGKTTIMVSHDITEPIARISITIIYSTIYIVITKKE